MPIDRAVTLRNAEKLIRQGKLEAAIGEFLRIVEDQPQDWNAKNTLGDLYARAGQIDKAIDQFMEIADNLNEEGAVAKAGAVYKKILKLKPDHEHSILMSGDLSAKQGIFSEAKKFYLQVAEKRKAKGDRKGAAEIAIKIGTLDPDDLEARIRAAKLSVEMGDILLALKELKDVAARL